MSSHPKPAVTVDVVLFSVFDDDLKLLLIQRGNEPFKDQWALPGGFVEIDEPLEAAARRELEEETGVPVASLEQLYTFGDPGRDPRGRTISVVYFSLVEADPPALKPATDAAAARWFSAFSPPRLAFDHEHILDHALERLRRETRLAPLGFDWLPPHFTLTQLQRLHEIIRQRGPDPHGFHQEVGMRYDRGEK